MKRVVLFILIISTFSFAGVLNPFGLYINPGLITEQNFAFFGLNTSGVLLFKQDLYSIEDLNALLNDGIVNLETINKLSVYSFSDIAAYGTLKIGKFSLSPFINFDGYIGVSLPDEIKDFIVDNIEVDKTYDASSNSFIRSSVFADAGLIINIGKVFVAPSFYLPVIYSSKNDQSLTFEYTSSSSPAEANLKFQTNAFIYSYFPFDNLSASNLQDISFDDLGIALSVGYYTDNFGISVNNIILKPSISKYRVSLSAEATLLYSGEGTDVSLTYDATASMSDFESYLKEVSKIPEITGYYKTNGKLSLGFRGKYALDKKWSVGGFLVGNFGVFSPYYFIDYLSDASAFVHSFGSKLDIRIIYFTINMKLISSNISPFSANSFGVNFNFGLGF